MHACMHACIYDVNVSVRARRANQSSAVARYRPRAVARARGPVSPGSPPSRSDRRRMNMEQFEQKEQRRRDYNLGEGRGASLRSLRINQDPG